jgi:hypothetical protein
MSQVQQLSEFDKRQEHFARVRALIMQIVTSRPGLTCAGITEEFLLRFHFLPRIENRIRELRVLGYVTTPKEADGLLHVYRKESS